MRKPRSTVFASFVGVRPRELTRQSAPLHSVYRPNTSPIMAVPDICGRRMGSRIMLVPLTSVLHRSQVATIIARRDIPAYHPLPPRIMAGQARPLPVLSRTLQPTAIQRNTVAHHIRRALLTLNALIRQHQKFPAAPPTCIRPCIRAGRTIRFASPISSTECHHHRRRRFRRNRPQNL